MREHFEEAQFILSRLDRAHGHPESSLARIADGPELRFARHVEALATGGPAVLERVLWPTLLPDGEEGAFDPHGPRTIAALVALSLMGSGGANRLVDVMRDLSPDQRSGILRAFVLWDDEEGPAWIEAALAGAELDELAGWLEVAAARRMNVARDSLDRALRKGSPSTVAAALDAVAVSGQRNHVVVAEYRLEDPEDRVRRAALRTAAVLGSPLAWPLLTRHVHNDSVPLAGELVAMLGAPVEHDAVITWAREPNAPEHALWCLGLTGRAAAAHAAARRLDDERPRVAKLAFEAFRAVTGLPADRAFVERGTPVEGEIQPEDLSSDPVDALPMPRVDEVRAWWERHRDEFDPTVRHVHGERLSSTTVRDALLHGSARRRHVLALELAARSNGACQVPTRAWSWRQRDSISSVEGLSLDFQASFLQRRIHAE